jgi:hypothetical protein
MALHYPHTRAKENNPGLHYTGISPVIHNAPSDF